ncbi:unnamed protein product [Penicillium olsonii]|nr:unnamed protein product [Penicillium olsonii]
MESLNPSNVFNNLDVFCDWNGNPDEPVGVTINIDVWGLPNLNLPILNVHYSNVVKGPSQFVYQKTSQTPEHHKARPNADDFPRHARCFPNSNSLNGSEFGSVVAVQDLDSQYAPTESPRSHTDGRSARATLFDPTVGILHMYTKADSPERVTGMMPPRSRKRSANIASLPDSIDPDEEDSVSRHKAPMTETDSAEYQLCDSPSAIDTPTPSSIPLPVSPLIDLEADGFYCEKLRSSGPLATAPSVRFKDLSPEVCSPTTETGSEPLDSLPDYETPVLSPDTSPSKNENCDNVKPVEDETTFESHLTEENLAMGDDQSESLRACDGSLVGTEDSEGQEEGSTRSFEPNGSTRDFTAISKSPVLPHSSNQSDISPEPELVLEDGIVYFRTPPGIHPTIYQIDITLEITLRKGKSPDWWELDLRGLPTLGSSDSGYLYFRTNPGRGMEFGTLPFKRNTVVENCLMAQFIPGKNLVVPLRNCNAEHYGFINDYRINSVLHSEIFQNSSGYAIEYTAVCSVSLINHRFWSEQCSFRIYVHGGPDGKWSGHFTETQSFKSAGRPILYNLLLDPPADAEIGVSRIEMTCPPAALDMFAVQWEIRVPRGKALITPCIKNTLENDAEMKLRNNFDFVDRERYVLARPWKPTPTQTVLNIARLGKSPFIAPPHRFARQDDVQSSTAVLLAESSVDLASIEPLPAVTMSEEPDKPPSTFSVLSQATWRSAKFLFYACWFLATIPSAYWSYIILSRGYVGFDSAFPLRHDPLPRFCDDSQADTTSDVTTAPIYTGSARKDIHPLIIASEPNTEPLQAGIEDIEDDDTMSLRDRIDYFLGWRGPVIQG